MSALTGEGIPELKRALFDCIPEAAPAASGTLADFLVYRPRPPRRRAFRVFRTDRGFLVTGRDLASVPEAELEEALRAAGARPGDEVTIGDTTLQLA